MTTEWQNTTLGSLLSFSNGRTSPDRADTLPYPVYGSNGIIGYSAQANADARSIIIGRVGTYCGSLYLSKQRCWVTDNAIRATGLGNNDPQFLYYLLCTLSLNNWRSGSGQPLLNQDILSRIPAFIPTKTSEQRAIAHILGSLDDKIELNRRMNETLEAMARALFKSWFVDFDPVRAKAEGRDTGLPKEIADLFPDSFEDSELGEVPKGWTITMIGEIAVNHRRGIQPDAITPATPYIGLEHMPRQSIALSEWGHPEELGSNKYEFRKGEMLFGKLRPYFHKVGVAAVDGICSTDIVVITPKKQTWYGLVIGHISSVDFVEYTNAGSTGTKMPRTSWHEMARYAVVLPPMNIADKYTAMIQPMIERITANIHESRALAAQRDTLMPKLLSGEVRLNNLGLECIA